MSHRSRQVKEEGMEIGDALAKYFRGVRMSTGISQENFAKKVKVSRSTYTYIEQGNPPTATTLDTMLESVGLTWKEMGEELDRYKMEARKNEN